MSKLLSKHFGEEWRNNELLKFYSDLEKQKAIGLQRRRRSLWE